MITSTQPAHFAAAVGLLAIALALPRAEAHTTKGGYYVAYQPSPASLLIHTETAKTPKAALAHFRKAAVHPHAHRSN